MCIRDRPPPDPLPDPLPELLPEDPGFRVGTAVGAAVGEAVAGMSWKNGLATAMALLLSLIHI